tara:strand:+ start:345 stop:794 length:450 start_codon:yes stop_codon:yes gene_type:complete
MITPNRFRESTEAHEPTFALADIRENRAKRTATIRQIRATTLRHWAEAVEGENRTPVLMRAVRRYSRENVRDHLRGLPEPLPRPQLATLVRHARNSMHYAKGPYHNPYDSEYYSACGYDDYLCEQRAGAEGYALTCLAVARELKNEGGR